MAWRLHTAIGNGQNCAQLLQQLHQEPNDHCDRLDPGSHIDPNPTHKACHSLSQPLCVQLQLPTLTHQCLETLGLFEGYCSHQYDQDRVAHFGFDPSFIHNPTPQLQNYTTVREGRSSRAKRTIEHWITQTRGKNVENYLFQEVRIPKNVTITRYSKTVTITTGNLPNLKPFQHPYWLRYKQISWVPMSQSSKVTPEHNKGPMSATKI